MALTAHLALVLLLIVANSLRPQPPEPRVIGLTLGMLGPSAAQVVAAGLPPPVGSRRAPVVPPSLRPPELPVPAPPQAPPSVQPTPDLRAEPLPLHPPALDATGEAASPQTLGLGVEACDLTLPIQAALAADAGVRLTIPRIPRAARSAANAVVLWNAGWIEPDRSVLDVTEAFRAVIVANLATAKPACLSAVQAGPRFIALSESPSADAPMLVVVLGSGQWKWSDLASPAPAKRAQIMKSPR